MVYRTSSAHEEGGDRVFSVSTERFIGEDGRLTAMELVDVEMRDGAFVPIESTRRRIPADYVFLAMGFVGPEGGALADQLGLAVTPRGTFARHDDYSTDVEGVFVAGDAGRGQSLIVWAIAEGRAAAASVDRYLMGSTNLPAPIRASARPVTV